jgi:hypothetical protein
MAEIIEVLTVGTRVTVGGNVPGAIIAVQVQPHIQYRVSWWNGRQQQAEWFFGWEITAVGAQTETAKIGFVGGG